MAISTKAEFIAIWTEIDKAYGAVGLASFGGYDNATAIDATAIVGANAFAATLAEFPEFTFTFADTTTTVGQVALAANLAFIKLGDQYVQWLEDGNPPILEMAKDRAGVGALDQSYHDNILGNLSDTAIGDRFNTPVANSMDVDVTGDSVNDIELDPRDPATDAYAGTRPYFSGNETDTSQRAPVIAFDQANDLFYAYPDMSLQAVIDAAATNGGGTVYLAPGTYDLGTSTLNVYGGVSLVGSGEGTTTLDASGITGYGIFYTSDNSTLSDFTLDGPMGSSGYGIKAQPDTADANDRLSNITIENVTVTNSGRSEIDLNGVDGATLRNVTADGNGTAGVGIAITDSADVTLENVTTIDNAWGSVGLFPSNTFYNQQLDNVVFTGTYTHNEAIGIYQDNKPGAQELGEVTFPSNFPDSGEHAWKVTNDSFRAGSDDVEFTFYFPTESDATDFALALQLAPNVVNQRSVVQGPDDEYVVVEGMSIQAAIDAAGPGDTINVNEGTYTGNVNVNESVTIVGVGDVEDIVIQGTFKSDNGLAPGDSVAEFLDFATAYTGAAGAGLTVSADNVTIQNLTITSFLTGIELANGTDGATIDGVTIDGTVNGIRKGSSAQVSDLTVTGGAITDGVHGVYFAKESAAGGQNITGVTIDGTHFEDLIAKGIYAESLDGTTLFDNLTMDHVGEFGRGDAFGDPGVFGNGIDINLKYGAYNGTITIEDFNFTNTGNSTGVDATGHMGGAAIALKGRDDPGHVDYGANPADVSGLTILIQNGTIDGTSTGIRVGEPGKANPSLNVTGPEVTVTNVTISNNLDNAKHADVDNVSKSTLTVNGTAVGDTYTAVNDNTSTGDIVFSGLGGDDVLTGAAGDDTFVGGANNDTFNGGDGTDTAHYADPVDISDITASGGGWQVATGAEGTDTLNNVERITWENDPILLVGNGGFATVQEAVDAAQDGDTILIAPGSYSGIIDIHGKNLTITSGNAGIDPSLWTPGSEVIIDRIATDAALTVDGIHVHAVTVGAGFVNGGTWEAIGFVGDSNDALTVVNSILSIDAGGEPGADQGFGLNITYNTGDITIDNVTIGPFEGGFANPAVSNYGAWINGTLNTGRDITVTNNTFDLDTPRQIALAFDGQVGGPQIDVSGNSFGPVGTAPGAVRVFDFGDDLTGPQDYSGVTNNTFSDPAGARGLMTNETNLDATGNGVTVTFGSATYSDASSYQSVVDATDAAEGQTLSGTSGSDLVNGSAFDDTITGGNGDDDLNGNAGTDTASYANTATISTDGSSWSVTAGVEGTDSLSNIEIVDGAGAGKTLLVGDGGFGSIQGAIDASDDGDTILISGGTYNESLTINGKAITLQEAAGQTVILQANASSDAITLSGDFEGGDVSILGLDIRGVAWVSGSGSGVKVNEDADVGTLTLDDVNIQDAGAFGVFINGEEGGNAAAEVVITDSTFSNNGTNGTNGGAHIKLFGFPGDATIENVTMDGAAPATPVAQRPDYAIEITGMPNANLSGSNAPDLGTVVIENVTVTGWYHKNAAALFNLGSIDGLDISGVQGLDLSGVVTDWGPVFNVDGVTDSYDASDANVALPASGIVTELQGDKPAQTDTDQTITGTDSNDRMMGKTGNDTLFGGQGDDELFGHDKVGGDSTGDIGNDSLDGGTGADTMAGGLGDDTYFVDDAGDVVTEAASQGTDLVNSTIDYALTANVENLTLVEGSAATDGTGNILNNVITGNSNANTLTGGGADDALYGGDDDDLLVGGSGNDRHDGGTGADQMVGASGDDTYVVDNAGDTISDTTGTDKVESSITHTLQANMENLELTGSDDINGTGNASVNVLTGNSGNNVLDGQGAVDSYAGGDGDDTYIVDNTSETVTENADEGIDLVQSSADYTLSANVENLALATGGLVGTGNELNNDIAGNSGNNTLYGLAGTDTLTGGSGDDQLYGGTENDTLFGGSNNDLMDGGTGADDMQGASGNDTYVVDDLGDTVTETSGTDLVQASVTHTLSTNVENLELTGTDNIDGTGNSLNNTITGNSGNNRIDGLGGADIMNGGSGGDDTYVVDNAGDTVTDTSGTDTVESSISYTLGADIENLTLTGIANINGAGNAQGNTIVGNDGNNTLNGLGGADAMSGGLGDDTYVVNNVNDTATENSSEGTDLVQSSVSYTLSANVENLTLTGGGHISGTGNSENNVLTGNTGANLLTGNGGTDTMIGGDGNDTYVVDSGDDTVTESGTGTDHVQSSVTYTLGANLENLTLTGADDIDGTGNALSNEITGNEGDNRLDGGTGGDDLRGGAGDDTYVVDDVLDEVHENFNAGVDLIESSVDFSLFTSGVNVENLTLTGTDDIDGSGNGVDNILIGNDGDNRLNGLGGDDQMSGGLGDDTYVVNMAGDQVIEAASEGTDTVESSISYTLDANLEHLTLVGGGAIDGTGNAGNNTITGNTNKNLIDGSAGADTMVGGAGNDTYVVDDAGDVVTENAAEGVDSVQSSITYTLTADVENLTLSAGAGDIDGTGNSANNVIVGNEGENRIDGGAGNDDMYGGAGDDLYIVASANDDIFENASEGTDSVESSVNYTLSDNVENLTLTGGGNRTGTGNAEDNVLTGNSGANTLTGLAGEDTLHGNGGNDTLDGGADNDTATYATSIDTSDTMATSMIQTSGGGWQVTTGGAEGTDTLTDVEIVDGAEAGRILLVGNGGFDSLADALTAATDGDTIMLAADYTYVGDLTISKSVTILGANYGLDGGEGSRDAAAGVGESTLHGHFKITATGPVTIDGVRFLNDATTSGGGASNPTLQIADGSGHTVTNSIFYSTLAGGANGVDDRAISTTTGVDAGTITISDNHFTGASAGGFGTASWGRGVWFDGGNGVVLNVTGNTFEFVRTGINLDMSGTATALVDQNNFATNGTAISGGVDNDFVTITDNNMENVGTEFNFRNLTTNVTFDADVAIDVLAPVDPAPGNDVVVVLGGSGNDDISGTDGVDFLDGNGLVPGNADDDTLNGRGGDDILVGRAGNDLLDGGDGVDSMTGGAGDDTYIVDDSGDVVTENSGEGTDTVEISQSYVLSGNIENLTLTGGDDIDGTGDGGANVITGNSGNNRIDGAGDADTMTGGDGDDTYVVDNAGDTVTEAFGEGTDLVESSVSYTLTADVENLTLTGGAVNATGNALNNTIVGNGNSNLIDGQGGADAMSGGAGDDTYVVDDAGDTTSEAGGSGTDLVQASVSYTLAADIENLTLLGAAVNGTGNAQNNTIVGNGNGNLIDGQGGADTMSGGAGDDTYVVDNVGDTTSEAGGSGTDLVEASVTYALAADIENLTLTGTAANGTGNILGNVITGNAQANNINGQGGHDTLTGNGGTDTLIGGNGNDNLDGGSENDTLTGGADNDTLNGGTGDDQMFGGTGNDTYFVDSASDLVSEGSGQGTDTVHTTVNYTLTNNVENLTLDSGAINGTGNTLGNTITGNSDSNVIDGKAGNDALTGGAGADTFVFSTTLNGATNVDSVSDFSVADDTFNLKQSLFGGQPLGTLDAGAFVTGAGAGDATDRIVYNSATGDLFFDADGNGGGAQVKFATIGTGLGLTNNDFIIVA